MGFKGVHVQKTRFRWTKPFGEKRLLADKTGKVM